MFLKKTQLSVFRYRHRKSNWRRCPRLNRIIPVLFPLSFLPHGLLARTHTAPAFPFKSRALGSPSLIILAYEHSEKARAPQHANGLSSLHGNRGGATAAAAGNRSSRGATAASRCGATANSDQRSRASCAPSADRPAKASEGRASRV
jgi:hypothetical protein